jgi:hypothetical protein
MPRPPYHPSICCCCCCLLRSPHRAPDCCLGSNGAYYYYQTANGTGSLSPPNGNPGSRKEPVTPKDATGYQQTMRQLLAYFEDIELPVAAIQYDSWWY